MSVQLDPKWVLRASGALSDVYEAVLPDGRVLAKRRCRSGGNVPLIPARRDLFQRFIGRFLSSSPFGFGHPDSVWPIESIHWTKEGMPELVMPWCKNGNILEYVRKHPGTSKLRLALECASALRIFHCLAIPHGNINPNNFLVRDDLKVMVSDPQVNLLLQSAFNDFTGFRPIPSSSVYKPQDEFSNLGASSCSLPGDVYAFASSIYELFAGTPPFRLGSVALVRRLSKGEAELDLARRHQSIGDELWNLLRDCWSFHLWDRPTMQEVVQRLQEIRVLFPHQ
ncbi:hypothetical protein JAAARDRAFT_34946 [Jaapia argillacea MUCL 33604]|uniref:Protein kinase domain-containing protein n=1 Tax=Jaapia argillacea MUCL 33604 TaxID=933084 RepID=A0A067Q3R8_9AGAM|nr:hypothetical protein JAAARDRAFT_34946 [Jaapia argillacea MUCL 33604]